MELRLSTLERAYMELTYGNEEPDHLLSNKFICQRLMSMMIELYTRNEWPGYISGREAITRFHNAKVVESELIPDGMIAFVNVNKLNDNRYNGLFDLSDLSLTKQLVPENIKDIVRPIRTRFPEGAEL